MAGAENLKSWRPGQSGNPGGRKKTLTAEVRKVCGESGSKLVKAFAIIAFGTSKEIDKLFGGRSRVQIRDRLDALKELADRGFGKPTQSVELAGEDGGPIVVTFGGRYKPKGDE